MLSTGPTRLWTRSGILKKNVLVKKLLHPFRGGGRTSAWGYLTEFSKSSGFFGLACLTLIILSSKYFFLKHHGDLLSSAQVLLGIILQILNIKC